MFARDDTIVAIATPQGRGGIGVVRLSGPASAVLAQRLVRRARAFAPRHATFARLFDPAAAGDAAVDQVVVTWFPGPASYTGEDVVEISGHGSPWLMSRLVELAMQAGARLAEPGEFTLRAYLNGRLDLVQAEAVADLVEAVTPQQARAAMDQLEGTLTAEIARLDAALFDLTARLEASLDFPEEGFHFVAPVEAAGGIRRLADALDALARQGRRGRLLRDGAVVAIVGRPNAGKSSLFNALVGADRAIVTDRPGTTRDSITERVDIGGIPVTLVDTAGLRESEDPIEIEGVARTRQTRSIAALTLIVFDRSTALTDDDRRLRDLEVDRRPHLLVASKTDLAPAWTPHDTDDISEALLDVSAVTGAGLPRLREAILAALSGDEALRDTPRISNVRHVALVETARDALMRAAGALESGATEELALADSGGRPDGAGGRDGPAHIGRLAAAHLQPVLHRQVGASGAPRLQPRRHG